MDAVGEVLAEREKSDIPWAIGTSFAVLLHAGVAAMLVISALYRPARFIAPRAVAVRLVQAGTLTGGQPVLVPTEATEKPKILKPAPPEEQPPPPSSKAKLLPAKEKEEKKWPSVPGPPSKTSSQAQPAA